MLQIVYISTAREPVSDLMLQSILSISRRNNRADGITGLLVVGGRRFLQALEGPEAAVVAAFERIQADPRHFAIVELARRELKLREFGDWSMGHVAGGTAAAGADAASSVAALVAPIEDANLRAQFSGFAQFHGRAA